MATQRPFAPVLIIGGGFSGIAIACQLKAKLGFDNFILYERSPDYGGTWFANQYPGCSVDVPSICYSLSFAPNPNFSKVFPDQSEIHQYIKDVAKRFSVDRHIECNISWEGGDWQEGSKSWINRFKDLTTGEYFTQESKLLISCVGGLVNPNEFNFPGIDQFKGEVVHSARWKHDVVLKDKDVAVVGNGCSATQIIPAIADEVSHLYQFIRTPQYYFPRVNPTIPSGWKWMLRYVPGFNVFFRWAIFLLLESDFAQFYLNKRAERLREKARKESQKHIKKHAPKEYWDMLTPKYAVGCKRRIFDPGYVPCLARPNVHMTDDPIVEIEPQAVVTKSGKHYPTDVIILANGFAISQFNVPIRGRQGATLHEHWAHFGGLEAYKATAMNDFPNFFIVLGPNASTGHTSVIYSIECTVQLIIRLIQPILKKQKDEVEVKYEAEKSWSNTLQKALKQRVWADQCNTYYVDQKTGWNFATYPFSSWHLWWVNRFPSMKDWRYE